VETPDVKNTVPALALGALVAALGASQLACSGPESKADEVKKEEPAADAAAGEGDGKTAEEKKKDEAVPVEVVALARGPIEEVLRFSSNLEAESQVQVFAEAARKVVDLRVEEGHRVAKGHVLLRLQDDEQRTRLAKVESQLAKARREYERQERLFADELISEQAFSEATYELEQLELSLADARRELSYTEVRAPIAGTVTRRLVNLGDFVTVNQPLFEIVDFGSIVARVFVPEKELPRLAAGVPARIVAPALGGERFPGEVERLAPVVDPKSGTVKVTVALPERAGLRPGMYVDVELVTAVRDDALLVPKRALVYDQDQVFVYRLGADRKVERVFLQPRLEDKQHVEPAGGLAPGDRVVVAGQAGLKEGVEVRPIGEVEAPATRAEGPAAAQASEPAAKGAA
jgi:membrane fusion protein (multidrug efflux system)